MLRYFSVTNGKYVLVFGLALAYFIYLTAPGVTWVNTDADGVIYLHAAKFKTLAHPTGAPLFNLINIAILETIPWGGDFYKLALVSAVASSTTALLLYRITRSIVAPLIFMASGVVVSQSTILETYALISLIMVAQYHWRHKQWVTILLAVLGAGIHHIILLSTIPLMISQYRAGLPLRYWSFALLGSLWYIYIPLFNEQPGMFMRGSSLGDYIGYFTSQGRIILGLAVISPDALIRVPDVLTVFVGGFLLASGPVILALRKDLLSWLFILPWLHYALAFPHLQYIWTLPAFGYGAILAHRYMKDRMPQMVPLVGASAAVFMVVNLFWYDIGTNLDKDKTAEFYIAQLSELPPDAIVWNHNRGWEHMTTVIYNREHGTNFTNLRTHQLSTDSSDTQANIVARAFLEMWNRPIYKTEVINPATYQAEIVRTTAPDIWPEVVEQIYWPRPAPEDIDEWDEMQDIATAWLNGDSDMRGY